MGMGGREAAGPSWDPVLFCRFLAAFETFCVEGRKADCYRRREQGRLVEGASVEAAGQDSSAPWSETKREASVPRGE